MLEALVWIAVVWCLLDLGWVAFVWSCAKLGWPVINHEDDA